MKTEYLTVEKLRNELNRELPDTIVCVESRANGRARITALAPYLYNLNSVQFKGMGKPEKAFVIGMPQKELELSVDECCRTCRRCFELQKWDYSNVRENGVVKQMMEGFACTAFADNEDRLVIQHIGTDIDHAKCEMYQRRA